MNLVLAGYRRTRAITVHNKRLLLTPSVLDSYSDIGLCWSAESEVLPSCQLFHIWCTAAWLTSIVRKVYLVKHLKSFTARYRLNQQNVVLTPMSAWQLHQPHVTKLHLVTCSTIHIRGHRRSQGMHGVHVHSRGDIKIFIRFGSGWIWFRCTPGAT